MKRILALALLLSWNANAALPGYPTFTLTPPSGTTTIMAISKFDFLCHAGLNDTSPAADYAVKAMVSPPQPIVYPVTHSFAVAALADGPWTCFVNAVISSGERTPTNRVSFSLQKPVKPPVFNLTVQ